MPRFKWEGRVVGGGTQSGTIEAINETVVRSQLRQQRIIPTKIKKLSERKNIVLFKPKVKAKTLAIFTRQLATMIDAGLPLVQSLDILADQEENVTFKEILSQVKDDVESGMTFAAALKKHPKAFNDLYTNMVVAGEEAGTLDIILNRLATFIEKAEALRRKIKSAMMYPMIVTFVAVVVVGILMVFVIPTFEKMFREAGQQLPGLTQLVVDISKFIRSHILIVIGIVIALIIAIRYIRKTDKGKKAIDKMLLSLPIFGILLRKVAVARFTRTLSTLMQSGVPILDGLQLVAKTSGNKVIEDAVMEARENISSGENIAEPLERSKVFPPMVTRMISVGENTGALDQMLNKIADFYEDEVDTAVAGLTSMLEPLMIVFLGGVVGTIVIAMYLPIFNMANAIG
ncbi:MAG: type II secretion system F family protein [Deltaproteobacteria bacterium]|nr:MAG: type II secretion system F family protein [Deltaproteobacteria bacterium]